MKKVFMSVSEKETKEIASEFSKKLKKNDIIALKGELGAGKSVFVKGVCRGLGIDENRVKSPTFTLLNVYENDETVYHMDLYRISDLDELYYLGFEEFSNSGGITLIEWADKIYEILPENTICITIEIINHDKRKIIIEKGE
ncbi:MAG: tRNA (adenosine(37)-N6)-threonylcarbamoyltransferase complex ATPase subunit type 1 TsaE [Candidatus Mcinerneyibacterium aminivorans]|jgi:tRNA threonylcarbamoyladenosine biosynthesis protein TsaE|uniref:tRNA threonylcarbamoyladenosine biosynthesis protein TsaE n=1 Tax=Candidatus Mcinerneyibacterium aminivorans TaxID=2703815 RepID=A0A5D0MKG4_9BACT|nr:MAG: tRNA (adenosine(37)-N6)-threonylcarbamoyltransferase complex ATPase subunit type 1 TsaE [Candidatus Mcinerneyibacterium aminivorans]